MSASTFPALRQLIDEVGAESLLSLLDIAEHVHGTTDLSAEVRAELDVLVKAEQARVARLQQLEFDLARLGRHDRIVRRCQVPLRYQVRDYALWLRAGGGQPTTALCLGDDTCVCSGTGRAWETTQA